MERTDRPSRDCLLFQNWMSGGRRRGDVLSSSDIRAAFWMQKRGQLTILEGEELKDAVHDGDHNGETQQVWVGF